MRPIKFRAWNGHKMYYDDLTVVGPDMGFNALIAKTSKIFNLMQYTGLKDKNGKEIYEGDILYHDKYSTEFKEGDVEIVKVETLQQFFEDRGLYTREYGEDWDSANFEIIGNIYENPELIK